MQSTVYMEVLYSMTRDPASVAADVLPSPSCTNVLLSHRAERCDSCFGTVPAELAGNKLAMSAGLTNCPILRLSAASHPLQSLPSVQN